MYEDYLAQTPTMVWNTTQKYWEYSTDDQLFALSVPFLETWPTSGLMLNGMVYAPQTQEPHTTDTESSSLLPTPTLGHIRNHDEDIDGYLDRREDYKAGRTKGMPGMSLGVAVRMVMLPTPTTQDGKNNGGPSQFERNTKPLNTEVLNLLPTPQTSDGSKGMTSTPEHRTATGHQIMLSNHAPQLTNNWGKFEPAIRQWEQVTGIEAPTPTRADGKDGAHRLSPEFTEWLMGLTPGWLTNIGLTRNEELKACGNGVVPQQAALALSLLDPQD